MSRSIFKAKTFLCLGYIMEGLEYRLVFTFQALKKCFIFDLLLTNDNTNNNIRKRYYRNIIDAVP